MDSIDKRAIFEGMTRTLPVLAFVVDSEGVFREVIANGYTEDLLNEEPSATIGKSIHDLFATEKAETFEATIDQALQTGAVQKFEYSLPIKGKSRTFAGYMAPMDEELGEPLVIWVAEDITERRDRNRQLERHEVFLESIREEVLVTDTDFVITYESAAVPEIYGYEQGARVGDSILQYVHPDDTDHVRTHFEEQLDKSGPTKPVEYRGKNKDGTWTWVESQARLLDDHPAIGGIVITSHEISERIKLRKERKRQHDHLVNAERLARMGGWVYRQDTETLEWTEGTQRIFEVSDTFEPSLSKALDFYHDTDQSIVEKAVEKCLETGVQYNLDAEVITAEGRQRWVNATGTRSTEDGETKLSGIIQDITNRRSKQQRLEVLNRLLRHNLRNELNSVQGFAEVLQSKLPDGSQDYSAKIIESAERLLSLAEKSKKFDDALAYNYITGPVDLATILDDLCAEYREQYPEATIETELGDAQTPGNEMAIKLIFDELLENALKHNDRDHPRIKVIVASRDDNRAVISVVDNGPGLPETEQQVIQEGKESALLHSDGIGLWTTNWLVSELSGDIRVTVKEGEGTTISIQLPADEPS